jgi:hypothetical protein
MLVWTENGGVDASPDVGLVSTAQSRLIGTFHTVNESKLRRPGRGLVPAPGEVGACAVHLAGECTGLIPLKAIMFRRNKTRIRAPSRVHLWARFQTSPVCLPHRARARARAVLRIVHPWPKVRPRNGRNGMRVLRDADGKNNTTPTDRCRICNRTVLNPKS